MSYQDANAAKSKPPGSTPRLFLGPPPAHGLFNDYVSYLLPVPGDDELRIPFQGFSKGICDVSRWLRALHSLPASLIELALDRRARIDSACAGLLKFNVVALNIRHFPPIDIPPHSPFCVVLSTPATDEAIATWAGTCTVRPLHVTSGQTGGDLNSDNFSVERIRAYLFEQLRVLAGTAEYEARANAILAKLRDPLEIETLDFASTSHNTLIPNEQLLRRAGFKFPHDEPFDASAGDAQVLAAIQRSVERIRTLRNTVESSETPSLIVSTIGRSRLMEKHLLSLAGSKSSPHWARQIPKAIKTFRDQEGYFYFSDSEVLENPVVRAAIELRARELFAFTDAISVRAMSEFAAFIRLPAGVGRVWSTAKRVADCYRGNSPKKLEKLSRLMSQLKTELVDAMPSELASLIDSTPTGVRVVSDLPLEWYPMSSGEPLLLRHTCSRLPCAPGNVMFQETLPKPNLHLPLQALDDLLVVRSFGDKDPLKGILATALEAVGEIGLGVRIVDVHSVDEFSSALNSFEGAWLVFDGHGAKTTDASGLCIGRQVLDPFKLRGQVRMPPIVFPLACDIHPLDTEHSSAAVALLACGARTAIGSLLPAHATKSAMFLARLFRAVRQLIPMLFKDGIQRVSWAELFSVIQQSHIIHEVGLLLHRLGRLDRDDFLAIVSQCSARVMARDPNWYPRFIEDFTKGTGSRIGQFTGLLNAMMPIPESTIFVQLGDPESIIIHPNDAADRYFADSTRNDSA